MHQLGGRPPCLPFRTILVLLSVCITYLSCSDDEDVAVSNTDEGQLASSTSAGCDTPGNVDEMPGRHGHGPADRPAG